MTLVVPLLLLLTASKTLSILAILQRTPAGKKSNIVVADVLMRQRPENMSDFLKEEIILDSFVNSMPPAIPDDLSFLPATLDLILMPERDVAFFLFTRRNAEDAATVLRVGDLGNLASSNFSSALPTKVLIHGWTDTGFTSWMHDVRKNYLRTGNYNVIVVDWSTGSSRDYLTSARLTRQVGDYVSELLIFLELEAGLSLDEVHLLGHSLGAHVAGIVGGNLAGRVGRITGMDPARPDFEAPLLREPRDRLDTTDAKFVDVIHTCAGTAGFVRPVGHVDFYPNGGSFRQPGCPLLMTQYCSHGRSHEFMSESIVNPFGFPAIECIGWREFKMNRCGQSREKIVFMGESLSADARGVYFLETSPEPPYLGTGLL